MAKEITLKEARKKFLEALEADAEYWMSLAREGKSMKEIVRGVIFSILVIFDGEHGHLPSMDVVVRPHPSDKEYHIDEDTDYYKDGMVLNDVVEDYLHHEWANYMKH